MDKDQGERRHSIGPSVCDGTADQLLTAVWASSTLIVLERERGCWIFQRMHVSLFHENNSPPAPETFMVVRGIGAARFSAVTARYLLPLTRHRPEMRTLLLRAAVLAAVAVSGLQTGLLKATRCGAPPRLCADAADTDIYGRPKRPNSYDPSAKSDEYSSTSDSVVKVYTAYSSQHPAMPWTNKAQEEATGSGFSIRHDGELCIVTNAHVVADATYVEVRKAGDARKYVATRRKVAHECDLATLTVEDARFWEGVSPLSLGAMPSLQDEVAVVGYPEGGEGVSITQGVVSRIEIQRYAHSGTSLLAVQIDAAINPGNSGGPALNADGDVVGVAFQLQQESQNIGYVIPVPTIQHFLADAVPGDPSRCAGFCSLGIFWQACMCTCTCTCACACACALHMHCMHTAYALHTACTPHAHEEAGRLPSGRASRISSCATSTSSVRDRAYSSEARRMCTCTACIVCAPHAHRNASLPSTAAALNPNPKSNPSPITLTLSP